MENWAPGYSHSQIEEAQERYGLRFPPDLIELLRERRPADGYDWHREDNRIRGMLKWPLECLLFDVEQGFWWPDWGDQPATPEERAEILRISLGKVPRLIPLFAHRFLPETPSEAGNPVFSMHGFDTVYYGSNLDEYFANEFEGCHNLGQVRHIAFWSDIVEKFDVAYAYYAAAVTDAHYGSKPEAP